VGSDGLYTSEPNLELGLFLRYHVHSRIRDNFSHTARLFGMLVHESSVQVQRFRLELAIKSAPQLADPDHP
jgi:hypothetical protein